MMCLPKTAGRNGAAVCLLPLPYLDWEKVWGPTVTAAPKNPVAYHCLSWGITEMLTSSHMKCLAEIVSARL